mgnify:CR=1 FL=1
MLEFENLRLFFVPRWHGVNAGSGSDNRRVAPFRRACQRPSKSRPCPPRVEEDLSASVPCQSSCAIEYLKRLVEALSLSFLRNGCGRWSGQGRQRRARSVPVND